MPPENSNLEGQEKNVIALNSVRETPSAVPPPSSGAPQPGSAMPSGGMGSIMGSISSAISLVRNPLEFMSANKDTPSTVNDVMIKYVAVLAAIPFFATLIGDLWWYGLFGFAGYFAGYAFLSAILTYILDVAAVYVVAIAIRMLAPTFNSSVDQIKSLKLSAYIFTPVFLIAILNLIPLLSFLTILGVLYGLYILYLGLPILTGTSKEKIIPYVIGVVVATVVVYLVIGAIVGGVTGAVFLAHFGYFY
jgi:Yip1 domain